MYKLLNGVLYPAPAVLNGIVGFNKNEEAMRKDGWKELRVTGSGECIRYIEHAKYIEENHFEAPLDYKAAREKAYPSVGDCIDAIFKAFAGDPSEMEALATQRQLVKKNIRKPTNGN